MKNKNQHYQKKKPNKQRLGVFFDSDEVVRCIATPDQ